MPVSRNSTGVSGLIFDIMCSSTADSAPKDETRASLSPNASTADSSTVAGWAWRNSASSRAARDGRSN